MPARRYPATVASPIADDNGRNPLPASRTTSLSHLMKTTSPGLGLSAFTIRGDYEQ